MESKEIIEKIGNEKYPKHSSVTSLNKLIAYKSGLKDGIELMKGWAKFYEENKFRMYILNKETEESLLNEYLTNTQTKQQ